MVASGKECEAVLTQIMAAKSALNQVGMHVIGHAMKRCLVDEQLADRDEVIDAAFSVFLRFRELTCANQQPLPPGADDPEQLLALLRRLENEIEGVETAIQGGGDCERALVELTAATGTLNTVGLAVVGHSMRGCLVDDGAQTREQIIDQAIGVFLRYSACVS